MKQPIIRKLGLYLAADPKHATLLRSESFFGRV